MKLIILTQYFPPEVGAPQNRLFELALRLINLKVEVTVLTAMPHYPQMQIYKGYENKKYFFEDLQGIKVHRSSIFVPTNKSIISRLRNYFSFVISSTRVGKKYLEKQYDFLMCESPPLFLGYSAMYLAKKKRAKLIFNVSDLWPESAEKLGVVNNRFFLKMAYNLEKKIYKRSSLVTGQTQGICKSIKSRFPEINTFWLPNGVDVSYFDPDKTEYTFWRGKNEFNKDDFIILYAGILGLAQGLEVVLKAAKLVKEYTSIKFVLLGSGPEKERLIALQRKMSLSNVVFLDGVTKDEMRFILREVNAAVIPLRRLELFLGAIPSKIFENLAMKLPVLLGVNGEAKKLFVYEGKCAVYFEPENEEDLSNKIVDLYHNKVLQRQLGENGRAYVINHFNRNTITESFYEELMKLV